MKTRTELAETFMAAMLADPRCQKADPAVVVAEAFGFADAFLAAAGERDREQRESDAVWMLDDDGVVSPKRGTNWLAEVDRLLAGRERVCLRVYVEEVEK